MVDMMIDSIAGGNVPTKDTLENLRFVLEECFDRERDSLTQIQEELQEIIDSIPAKTTGERSSEQSA
jgi:hypothetical protein